MELDRLLGPVTSSFLRVGIGVGSMLVIGYFLHAIGIDIKQTIFLFFPAIVVAAAILPAVRFFHKWHIPKSLGIFIIYAIVIGIFAGVVLLLIPLVAVQIQVLIDKAPDIAIRLNELADWISAYLAKWNIEIDLTPNGDFFKETLAPHLQEVLKYAGKALQHVLASSVHVLVTLTLVLLFAFFLAKDETFLHSVSASTSDDAQEQASAVSMVNRIMDQIGHGIRAQLLIACMFGVGYSIALMIIGVPFAITIGASAVVLELIPFVGAAVALALSIMITLTQVPDPLWPVCWVLLSFFGISFLTHKVLGIKLMESFVKIDQVAILAAIVIGAHTWGFMGALLAVPAAITLSVLLKEWLAARRRRRVRMSTLLGMNGNALEVQGGVPVLTEKAPRIAIIKP